MKLSILEQVPVILFDTESCKGYWNGVDQQIHDMIHHGRAPAWIQENIVITDDPQEVIEAYRSRLQLF
jgi:predicted Rossmann-fold nucleotide-binding protein